MLLIRNLYHRIHLLILCLAILLLTGCYKFEGDQTVPAYLKIDTILLNTYYPEQGANSNGIKDVWVYVNNQQIGAFELPAMFPVLAMGEQELEIRPGIKVNGISSTRAPYPFYEPIVYNNFLFTPDSTVVVSNPKTVYYSNLNFAWMEDFEQPGLSIVESSNSDTSIVRTQPANNPEAYLSDNSKYSGLISLTKEKSFYSSASSTSYPVPPQGSPTLLEIDFKSDNLITVGIIIQEYGNFIKIPLVILNHADDWNKIYVNLGPNLSLHPQATDFKVFFESVLENGNNSASIYLDNLKLINRSF